MRVVFFSGTLNKGVSASLRGLLERAPPPLHALKSLAVSLLSLITLRKEMFLVSCRGFQVLWAQGPCLCCWSLPSHVASRVPDICGHPITIVGWRILQNALVSPSQAPPFSLSSLLFHGWDTKSIRHLRLCSRLRNAIRIQNCVETLNIKSAEFHFHWYSSESMGHVYHIQSTYSLIGKVHLKNYHQ